ncbi:ABC transporter permease [Granulosicoccus antarcticus]|nr:ABC transporter permease [Granulosicoccus antarcticus]
MQKLPTTQRPALLNFVITAASILVFWQLLVSITGIPKFMLPAPLAVFESVLTHAQSLASHSLITGFEIVVGLVIGSCLGIISAIGLTASTSVRRWALPLMVISQSLPVFALAPLLTLWFGYGISSKIIMAILIIYFPVVAATFDGLRHTQPAMLDLAQTLRATPLSIMFQIRLPAALPSIASGIRVATSIAPIGAVVGEWVGSSKGLGYLMLHANGRMQTDLMFAALLCLCLIALLLYFCVNRLLDRILYWQRDSSQFHTAQPHRN